jgi:hypothetical protein
MPRRTLSAYSLFSDLTDADHAGLIAGARDSAPVRGVTHGYYKYPARFSPAIVRAPALRDYGDVRLWRTELGRTWYSHKRGLTPGSAEVLLIHRKSK